MSNHLHKCSLKEVAKNCKTFRGKLNFIKRRYGTEKDDLQIDDDGWIDISKGFIFHESSKRLFKIEFLVESDDDRQMPHDISTSKMNDDGSIISMSWIDEDEDSYEIEEYLISVLDHQLRYTH